jgi:hypothetical protein
MMKQTIANIEISMSRAVRAITTAPVDEKFEAELKAGLALISVIRNEYYKDKLSTTTLLNVFCEAGLYIPDIYGEEDEK